MKTIVINTCPTYNVVIRQGALDKVGALCSSLNNYNKVAIIADDVVAALYLPKVISSFEGFCSQIVTYVFANGEGSKNLQELAKIYDFLAEEQITRTDLVIALGGGVCGDMVGFAAATYLRGVDFVNIPTTLLSMVDSSVGGKTAVNIDAGKNQVGAFYQPKLVVCDTDTLATLNGNLIADGVGEIAKYAVLEGKGLFELLLGDFSANLEEIIEICIKIKDEYVSGDVFDKGKRQLLNLGHTLGHVIEKHSGFSIAHGKAVMIGLYYVAGKFAGTAEVQQILTNLQMVAKKFDMPLSYPLGADELWKMAGNDKKRHGDYLTIARPYAIGDCRLENVKIGMPINLTERANCGRYDVIIHPTKLKGVITPPPSKSHLHRLLIAAAFCGKRCYIKNVCFSDDILATLGALKSIGAKFDCNSDSVIFDGIDIKNNVEIDCNESGSTFRFFIPICAMLGINARFVGSQRLGERGYKDVVLAMRDKVDFDKDCGLPLNIRGAYDSDEIRISAQMSSQFVSGIMLGAFAAKRKIKLHIEGGLVSGGYVDMTIDVIRNFGGDVTQLKDGFEVLPPTKTVERQEFFAEVDYSNLAFWEVAGVHLPLPCDTSKQCDKVILDVIKMADDGKAFDIDVDANPDLAPIFGVLLANLKGESVLKNCGRLRVKECDRFAATKQVLNAFNIAATAEGDNLRIVGGSMCGGITLDSYGDHRMAMMIAIAACFASGDVTLRNAQVVKKSYPNFWEDYIALGGRIDVINIG